MIANNHSTIIVEKIGEAEFLVVFPDGEIITCASKLDAQTAAKEYNHARAVVEGEHFFTIEWRGC